MRLSFLLFVFWGMSTICQAQGDAYRFALDPLGEEQKFINNRFSYLHSGIQPFVAGLDSTWYSFRDTLKSDQPKLKIFPLVALGAGVSVSDSVRHTWQASPGFGVRYNPSSRWDLGLSYQFISERMPAYFQSLSDSISVIPGIGFATSDENGSIAHYFQGHIGFRAGKYFHFEVGRGKHFWGDGYRSLVLSQNAAPYPYFRLDTRVWHLRLSNIIGQFRDRTPGSSFDQSRYKFGALHTVSWNISKMVNVSFYEMVVWQERDTLSERGLDLNYMHPLLFLRPVEFAQGSADNVLLGVNLSVKTYTNQLIYGQLFVDEFLYREVRLAAGWWANKIGGQLGVKSYDTFIPGLHFQAEVNLVRPFTYTHGSQVQAYGSQNQGLAHPLGTNFREAIFLTRYEHKDWSFLLTLSAAEYGRDKNGENYGGNLFRSYVNPLKQRGNFVGQGQHHNYWLQRLEVSKDWKSYELFADLMLRWEYIDGASFHDRWLSIGIRTPMLRNYRDF